jgi:hypothetical protein
MILLISASKLSRTTGVKHKLLAGKKESLYTAGKKVN